MKKNTWINIGFSLILFLMFVICSFFMLVFGARQYQKGIQVEQVREDTQIPLAYLSTKIHHASSSDAICLDDGVLKIQEDGYQTCIYEKNHALYEIVLKDGSDMSVGEGMKLYDLDSYAISFADKIYTIEINGAVESVGVK